MEQVSDMLFSALGWNVILWFTKKDSLTKASAHVLC